MCNHMDSHMKRKIRNVAGCLVITIPHQVCELLKFKDGDDMEIEQSGMMELRLRKA